MTRPLAVRVAAALVSLYILAALPSSVARVPWRAYAFHAGSFGPLTLRRQPDLDWTCGAARQRQPAPERKLWARHEQDASWHVTAATLADVTGDDLAEWVLVVWRPWRDWPIQSWSPIPSPLAGWHDAAGESCHLILLDPADGRQIWAGSALPAPLLGLAVGDVNGDARNEVVTLEGDYAAGRDGWATRADVWSWNSFGFTLEWRSPPDVLRQLCLTDVDGDSILDLVVR